jgi:hypothetical protein
MKFNYFFLLLISFVNFSLFSMDSAESSGTHVSIGKEKPKARSLPVSPFGTPPTSPKSSRSITKDARKLSDPLVRLPEKHTCTGCGESIDSEGILEHDVQACKIGKIIILMSSTSIVASKRTKSPLSRVSSVVDLNTLETQASSEPVPMDED